MDDDRMVKTAGRGRPRSVVLAQGVVSRPGAGGETFFFRGADPEGRSMDEALAAGWARLVEDASRRRPGPRPAPLGPAQEAALARVFRDSLRRR